MPAIREFHIAVAIAVVFLAVVLLVILFNFWLACCSGDSEDEMDWPVAGENAHYRECIRRLLERYDEVERRRREEKEELKTLLEEDSLRSRSMSPQSLTAAINDRRSTTPTTSQQPHLKRPYTAAITHRVAPTTTVKYPPPLRVRLTRLKDDLARFGVDHEVQVMMRPNANHQTTSVLPRQTERPQRRTWAEIHNSSEGAVGIDSASSPIADTAGYSSAQRYPPPQHSYNTVVLNGTGTKIQVKEAVIRRRDESEVMAGGGRRGGTFV